MYLKAGIWELTLTTSIKQIVTPDGQSWTKKDSDEDNLIRNRRFGIERSVQQRADLLNGVSSLPGGAVVYAASRFENLFRFLTHRPNMTLPPGTALYFRLDAVHATYIGPVLPSRVAQQP